MISLPVAQKTPVPQKIAEVVTKAGTQIAKLSSKPAINNDWKLIYPLPTRYEITSPFGYRIHPIHGDRRLHAGSDIGAPSGVPVLAAQDGKVEYADSMSGYGNTVDLIHPKGVGLKTRYAHLSQILVKEGQSVKKGATIGLVGATGGVTGPHLHFETHVQRNGEWVQDNPQNYINLNP